MRGAAGERVLWFMRYVPPRSWPLALGGYALAGILPGALDGILRGQLVRWNLPPAAAIVILVNVVLPILFVLTAAFYPRPALVLPGVLLALCGAVLVRIALSGPSSLPPSTGYFPVRLHPITVVATLISGAIALATCFATMPLRSVGVPPDPKACRTCGYMLDDQMRQCPECGEERA